MKRLALLTLLLASTASAQRFDVQQFRPAMTHRTGTIGLFGGEVLERDSLEAGLVLDWADSPLVVRGNSGGRFGELVSQQLTGHVVGAFGVSGIGEVLVDVPFILHQHGDLIPVLPNLDSNASGAGFGVGDLRLAAKFALVDNHTESSPGGIALSTYLQAQLPTGKTRYFQGGELRFSPGVALDVIGARGHRLTVNLGYTLRRSTTMLDLDVDDTIDFGAALTLQFTDWMQGIIETRGSLSVLAEDIGVEELPLEATLGIKMNSEWASLMVAGGIGVTEGFGTPDYRVILSASYTATSEPPRYDFDNDNIYDDVDQCPHEAEDRDGFEDHDGCPEDEGANIEVQPSTERPSQQRAPTLRVPRERRPGAGLLLM